MAGHLFGLDRTNFAAVRVPSAEAFGPHCLYCITHLQLGDPVDHVLPWSLVSIVDRVLDRGHLALEQIADEIRWPTEHNRVVATARGICHRQPAGIPTWTGYKTSTRSDISFPPWCATA